MPAMTETVVHIEGLLIELGGRRVLDVPRLHLRAGERVALVGSNGAGKSSLLKVLGGLLPATRGQVSVLGRDVGARGPGALRPAQWRQLRAELGQVMQGLHLVPRLSALENVVLGALARPGAMPLWRSWLRCYPSALQHEALQALADLGLAHLAHTRADQLSGGERQKTSIARLHLQRPRLILADEPTSALDPAATQQACDALTRLATQATLVTVVHDTRLLAQLADRVIGLKAGRVVFDLDTQALDTRLLQTLYEQEDHTHEPSADAGAHLPPALPLWPRGVSPAPATGTV